MFFDGFFFCPWPNLHSLKLTKVLKTGKGLQKEMNEFHLPRILMDFDSLFVSENLMVWIFPSGRPYTSSEGGGG